MSDEQEIADALNREVATNHAPPNVLAGGMLRGEQLRRRDNRRRKLLTVGAPIGVAAAVVIAVAGAGVFNSNNGSGKVDAGAAGSPRVTSAPATVTKTKETSAPATVTMTKESESAKSESAKTTDPRGTTKPPTTDADGLVETDGFWHRPLPSDQVATAKGLIAKHLGDVRGLKTEILVTKSEDPFSGTKSDQTANVSISWTKPAGAVSADVTVWSPKVADAILGKCAKSGTTQYNKVAPGQEGLQVSFENTCTLSTDARGAYRVSVNRSDYTEGVKTPDLVVIRELPGGYVLVVGAVQGNQKSAEMPYAVDQLVALSGEAGWNRILPPAK